MPNFGAYDIISAFIGWLVIGVISTLNLLLYGQITGLSGMLGHTLMMKADGSYTYKFCFVSGLVQSTLVIYLANGGREISIKGEDIPIYDPKSKAPNAFLLVVGGFLIGFGSRLGNGCTTGHGVCGLPRLALRSFVAVGCFMSTAFIFANMLNHTGFPEISFLEDFRKLLEHNSSIATGICLAVSMTLLLLICALQLYSASDRNGTVRDLCIKYLFGLVFGFGLTLAGMTSQEKIRGFLVFDKNWDISLMFVLMGAVLFNFVTFKLIMKYKSEKPVFGEKYPFLTGAKKVDWKLVVGASFFGVGWGTCFLCPGPAIATFLLSGSSTLTFIFIAVGMYSYELSMHVSGKIFPKKKEADAEEKVETASDVKLVHKKDLDNDLYDEQNMKI